MRRLLVLPAVVLAGCGTARTPVPDVGPPLAPKGREVVRLNGLRFAAPRNWDAITRKGTLAGGVRSRTATVAVWRYPRTEPLPQGRDELAAARDRLTEQVQGRDASFRIRATRLRARGIELLGTETIAGTPVTVRSTHLFADDTEFVIDQYARPGDFERVDRQVFRPVLRSLKLR